MTMLLINKQTEQVVTEEQFLSLHKNVLFGSIRENIVSTFGYSIVLDGTQPDHDDITHVVVQSGVEKEGERWRKVWTVKPRSDAAGRVRSERNRLLAQTDYMALSDTTLPPAWGTYRQALRDVPQQEGFPHNVTWPTPPT